MYFALTTDNYVEMKTRQMPELRYTEEFQLEPESEDNIISSWSTCNSLQEPAKETVVNEIKGRMETSSTTALLKIS